MNLGPMHPHRTTTPFDYVRARVNEWALTRVVIPIEDVLDLVEDASKLQSVSAGSTEPSFDPPDVPKGTSGSSLPPGLAMQLTERDDQLRELGIVMTDAAQISRGTGTAWERFWCFVTGGHKLGEEVPVWFKGGGRVCVRCGGIYGR